MIITISHSRHGDTTVKVVRETAKAILLAGNASEAWFPKTAIDSCLTHHTKRPPRKRLKEKDNEH
jgi:hypothetical protein